MISNKKSNSILSEEPVVRMEEAEVHYPGFDLDLSLKAESGMITGLVGANGSGKTTAFRLICGLEQAASGNVSVFGIPAFELPVSDKEKMGVVFSDSGFSDSLNPKDVRRILSAFYPAFDPEFYNRKCRELNVEEKKALRDMSSGQKARFKMICALSHHPMLLVLDEPTVGLDIIARRQILEMLHEFMEQEGRAILISSHIASDLESVCDDLYLIKDGKAIIHETMDALLSEYGLLKLTDREFETVPLEGVVAKQKTAAGWQVLVRDRQYYLDNFPQLVLEKGDVDDLLLMAEEGAVEHSRIFTAGTENKSEKIERKENVK